MARPVTLFTGQWADLPLDELAAEGRRVGLRRPRARLLGRPLRRRRGARATRLLRGRARELLERHGLGVLGDRQPPRRPGGLRPDRRAPPGASLPPEVWGDGDPEGVRQRAAEQMKDTARAAAKLGVEVVTGFTGSSIWHLLYSFPPNDFARDRARLRGVRRALEPDHRRLRGRGRAVRARGPPDRDRLRLRHHAQGARGDRRPPGLRHQLRPEPLRAPVPRLRRVHHRVRRPHLPRPRQGLASAGSTGARRSSAATSNFGEPGRGWDFVSPGPRRRRLRGDDPRAQPDRLRRAAVDRVGGLRHGPRLGRAGRARVRAPDGLRALARSRSTRRSRRRPEMSEVGFVTMGDGRAAAATSPPIGVGMLGYAFMGKAHSNAYKTLAYMTWPPPLLPAAGGDRRAATRRRSPRPRAATASPSYVTDWRALVADDRIELFDNAGPNNLHAEPTIAAAEAGKHVICEKPLGRDAAESYETWQRVAGDRRQAHVRLQLPLRAGRAARARDHRVRRARRDPPLPRRATCRSGARPSADGLALRQGGRRLGRARRPRRARHRPRALPRRRDRRRSSALTRDVPARAATVDDAVESVVALRERRGRHDRGDALRHRAQERASRWEINGSKGSIAFDLERLNELQVHYADSTPGARAQGFRTVLVSEADHPFWEHWWPQGHIIGWEHTFVHELHHLLTAIRDDTRRRPARRDARGRLPRRRGLRRDAALRRAGRARDGHLPQLRRRRSGRAPRPSRPSLRARRSRRPA